MNELINQSTNQFVPRSDSAVPGTCRTFLQLTADETVEQKQQQSVQQSPISVNLSSIEDLVFFDMFGCIVSGRLVRMFFTVREC